MTSKDENKQTLDNLHLKILEDDEDLLSGILRIGLQELMELERNEHIGAARYERSEDRQTSRNGYKPRQLYTRVGKLNLRVPQTRDGQFYPSIFKRYQRSEKALVAALSEAYLQGVSTRKMARVTEKLLGKAFSSSAISRFSKQLDAELEAWRKRRLTNDYRYVFLDARYERCRRDGVIVDIAVPVAIGVSADGYRHVLAVETGWGESEPMWTDFIGGLKQRGLSGVRLFTSDAHPGIRAAVRTHYPGTPWQRCQFHFLSNLLDKAPKKRKDPLKDAMKDIWQVNNSYKQAKDSLDELTGKLEGPLPEVADWLSENGEQTLTVFKVAPRAHRRRTRTTNSVERLHQELKRRSKPVRIFPNPESCLRLFGALLKEQHEDWIGGGRRYLRMEPLEEFEKNQKSSSAGPPKKIPKPTMA